jgi:hypothetical protein
MTAEHLAVVDLDEWRMGQFLDARRRRTCRGLRRTVHQLLEQLRSTGVIPMPEPARDDSPMAGLLARYEAYLHRERSLAKNTIAAYLLFVRAFVAERLDGGTAPPDALRQGDICGFLLARARRMAPKRAQYMGTALRSFLRFLFLRGETGTDLALAVPTMRQWRLASVPCHLPARDVERLLHACDRSSARGVGTTRCSCSSPDWAFGRARSPRSNWAICAGGRGRSSSAARVWSATVSPCSLTWERRSPST